MLLAQLQSVCGGQGRRAPALGQRRPAQALLGRRRRQGGAQPSGRPCAPAPCRAFKGDGGDEPAPKQRQQIEQQPAGPAAAAATATVTFKASHHVAFGQVLKVVGSAPQLGGWECDKAPAMQWSKGDQWLLSLDLPAGSHEFKLVVVAPPAKEGADLYADWEAGTNRTLKVPEVEAAGHGAFTVVCEWGHTESSMETLPSEELEEEEGEEVLSESEEPALRPEDLGAEPYSPNGDEGEAPVGVIGKMTIERAEEAQQPPAATATKPEAGQVGGVSVPAEAATADRSAASGQAEKAAVGGNEAALRAVFGWARRHDSEDEGEDGGGGGKAATPAAAATPAPAVEKQGGKQEEKGKKGAAGKKSKASKNNGSKAGGAEPVGAAGASASASPSAQAGQGTGGGGKTATAESGGGTPAVGASATAAEPGKEEGAAAKPAVAGGEPGGSASTGGSSASRDEPNPHAPVGMEAGDFPSQTPMGKRSDDTVSGVPAGGLKPSTEAAVKQELRRAALTGSQQSEDEDEGGSGPPGSGSSGGSSAKGSEGGSQAQQQRGEQGPPSSSAAAAIQEPPPGMQLAMAAAGLAALPVVAWSEWVLKSTGCGLPPGPSGLLGAAEGVSYLVVGGVVLWSLATKLSTGRGLPAGPGGALGAVEGGSWLAALSGVVVLALQWQTYGYIPSALPDSNCFGQPAGFATAQAPSAPAAASLAAAPPLSGIDSSKASAAYGGPMRLAAGRSTSLPQGNLLFSLETALSQSGGIVQGAETAAAAVAAAAAGQPPPAQVAAAVQELKSRALQAQQLVAALSSRAVGLGGKAGTESALQAAAAEAAAAAAVEAPAPAEPLGFQPPRHRVRAALSASVDRMLHSEKLRAVLEPVPLPAVARQAAQAAGGALSAVDAAAKEAVELSHEAVQREEQVAAAWGKRAVGGAISKAQSEAEQLSGAAADAQSRLQPWVPQLRLMEQREEQAAAAAAVSAAPPSRPSGGHASSSSKAVADAAKPSSKVAAEAAQPEERNGSGRKISGDVASIFGSVFSDLREGYVGLWHSAQHFDAQQTMASLQERLAAGQAAQARAHAAAEAAAHGGSSKAAGEAAKAAAKQQVALRHPATKRQSTVT